MLATTAWRFVKLDHFVEANLGWLVKATLWGNLVIAILAEALQELRVGFWSAMAPCLDVIILALTVRQAWWNLRLVGKATTAVLVDLAR